MRQKKSMASMLSLFLVLFIDGMGLGLFFPILNAILLEPEGSILATNTSFGLRNFYYGLTIGIFMICWFFGAAILGDLSDGIGRKKSLMICLLGSFLGYFFSAISISLYSLWLLIAGRVIAGFTAGSQPIAQAAIVDVSSEEQKPKNIGLILLAVSLGFVLGPVIGGVLSNSHLCSWFGLSTPMYFAALLSIFNALILQKTFKETVNKNKKMPTIHWNHALQIVMSAFRHKGIQRYSFVLLVMIFGWSNYFSFIPMYLLHTYNYNAMQNSLFLALLGLGFSLGCGYIVQLCTRSFKFDDVVVVGLLITSSQVLLTAYAPAEWVAWVATFIIGVSLSVAYSVLLTIFSNLVSKDEQGWVMGVTGSIMALCFGISTVFTGLIAYMGPKLPMILGFVGLFLSAVLLFFIKPKDNVSAP